jgi:glycerol uptake facilitator-like aquaporin
MNPVVSIVLAAVGKFRWSDVPFYVAAQVIGAILGVWAAHAMFGMPIVEISTKVRSGSGQVLSETVATSGLLVIILSGLRHRPDTVPVTVACYITAAYWFTASTSFANPAVTLARALTESFAGIRPDDVAGFWLGQVLGTVAVLGAYAMFRQGPRRELADS